MDSRCTDSNQSAKKYYSIEIFPNLRFPLKFCLNRLPINSLSEERRIYCPILVVKLPSLSRSQGQWFGLCLVLGTLVFGPRNNWSMGKPAQVWTIRETRNWIIGLNYSSIMRTVDNDVLIHRDTERRTIPWNFYLLAKKSIILVQCPNFTNFSFENWFWEYSRWFIQTSYLTSCRFIKSISVTKILCNFLPLTESCGSAIILKNRIFFTVYFLF